jgi:ABC-2 type transport system ATP-binding protein
LMLDEPATGLDPGGMRDMRALIRRLADEGITVLLSSHQLPEVQELCDRVAIVDSGRVVYEGALADLRRQGGAGYRLRTTDDSRALELARTQKGIEHVIGTPPTPHGLGFQAEERDVGALSLALAQAGIGILALTPELATLEDLFFRLTEGGLDAHEPDAGESSDDDAPSRGPLETAVSGLAASAQALEETR